MGKNGVVGIYDDDPRTNPNAKFIKDITYDEIIEKNELLYLKIVKRKNFIILLFSPMSARTAYLKAM